MFSTKWFSDSYLHTVSITARLGAGNVASDFSEILRDQDAGGNGLVGWQLQGDYSSTDALNIEFDELNLQAIPEPTTLGLLSAALVVALIRRKL
ncbi:MAG: PEP-CTERM sorting domain-containing protein [Verrucomicrobia bacterium]|nr:PEP-CTERM sorting domain-containing protein [Verrucomicrobiota bacterium]